MSHYYLESGYIIVVKIIEAFCLTTNVAHCSLSNLLTYFILNVFFCRYDGLPDGYVSGDCRINHGEIEKQSTHRGDLQSW